VVPPIFNGLQYNAGPSSALLLREGDRTRLRARCWGRLLPLLAVEPFQPWGSSLSGGAAGYSCSVFAVRFFQI